MSSFESPFAPIEAAPADPILGLTEEFLADERANKVNLGVGVYQDASGKVPVLETVREAERLWYEREETKSYIPIDGVAAYNLGVRGLLFGADSELALAGGRAVTIQAVGGTGALRVGADFLKRFLPKAVIHLSTPSWENHRAVFETAGFEVKSYPYYDPETKWLDWEGMRGALAALGAGEVVVLHASCHNPSGVDPDAAQWREIVRLIGERGAIALVDFAYQGFGDGIEEDTLPVRLFAESGQSFLVASSFSKNFSLYRERCGALTIVGSDAAEAKRLLSQLKRVIRTNYSSPPSHGAQIVAVVLGDPDLRARWHEEVATMRERVKQMRSRFVEGLKAHGAPGDFSFISRQRGMFSFSGLPVKTVHRLRSTRGLYIVDSGRICLAALNDKNLDAVCSAIASVLK